MPPFRLFGNVILTGLTRISTGYWRLMDPQNGFTAASRKALVDAEVGTVWEYYGYMNQLMARLNTAGVTVADVPMDTEYGDEESSIDYSQYIRKVSGLLVTNLFSRLRQKGGTSTAAVAVCYIFAAVCLLGGALRAFGAGWGDRDGGTGITAAVTAVAGALAGALIDSISDPTVLRWGEEE
jgi:hypothetical protein